MTTAAQITFSRRAKVKVTFAAQHRRYMSECGLFAIEEVRSKLETNARGRSLVYWLAIRRVRDGEYVIDHCRTRDAAERACEE